MCNETTLTKWAKSGAGAYSTGGLSRRNFAVLSGAAVLAACTKAEGQVGPEGTADAASGALSESTVTFETADGTMDAFWVHPASGKHPAVIFWPDIAGIRESKRDMARRLAGEGFSVLVLNPYYRDRAGEIWADFADFADGGWPVAREMRQKLSSYAIASDAKAAVAWLDGQEAVDTSKGIGSQGYCMGGPFTVYTAHAVPERVKAAASFHGGGLVREDDQSPHILQATSQASYLIAVAKNDDEKAPEVKVEFAAAAEAAGRPAEVEVYAGDHGWTVPDSPAYDEAAAEKAWARLLALYEGL